MSSKLNLVRAMHGILQKLPSTAFNSVDVPYACLSRWNVYIGRDEQGQISESKAMLNFHNR